MDRLRLEMQLAGMDDRLDEIIDSFRSQMSAAR